jgi:signal transduction histidine kinase
MKALSLFHRLALAFLAIVLLTTAAGVAVEFWNGRKDLPSLQAEVRARTLSTYLSALYAREGDWDGVGGEIRYLFSLEELAGESQRLFRYVVRDRDGRTVYNSFQDITRFSDAPLYEAEPRDIPDLRDGTAAGTVTVYLGEDYLRRETRDYLLDLLGTRLAQQGLMVASALILALIISRWISRPLSRMTGAIGVLAEGEGALHLPEVGAQELRDLARAYNQMAESLRQQRQMRKRMVADLAHDINNPLHAIMLEARALQDGLADPAESAAGILSDAASMRNLVYDLEWLAEVDSGEYRLNRQSLDCAEFARSLEDAWKPRAARENAGFSLTIDQDIPARISADPGLLRRAVDNLVENAIRYNTGGREVALRFSTGTSGSIVVSVCDDGAPIAEDLRERIFQRLYRGDASRSRDMPGSGLGLAIGRHIAELHGGTLRVELPGPSGNCFRLEIPA